MSRKPKGYTLFYREEKKRWVFSAPDPVTGEWKQSTVPAELNLGKRDRAQAEAFVQTKIGTTIMPNARRRIGGVTCAEVAPRWLALRKAAAEERDEQIAPATVNENESHLRLHVLPTFGARPVIEVADDIPGIRAWIRKLRGVLSAQRTKNVVSTFRTMLDDAKAEGWAVFAENPLRNAAVIRELPERRKREPVIISYEIAKAILACPKVSLERRVRLVLAVTSSLADGEMCGLTVGDIDLDAAGAVPAIPMLKVRQAARLIGKVGDLTRDPETGKAKKPSRGHAGLGDPKNEHRKRELPLHQAAVDAIREWLSAGAGAEKLLGRAPVSTDPLFPGKGGGFSRPASASLIRRDAETALRWQLEQAGADAEELAAAVVVFRARVKPLTWHATRRTTLTWLKDAGVNDALRKRLAGHTGGGVTEEHYTRREVAELAEAVQKIDITWTPTLRDPRRPSATDIAPCAVPESTTATDTPTVSGAPGRNRTCDLRFRKTRGDKSLRCLAGETAPSATLSDPSSNGLPTSNGNLDDSAGASGGVAEEPPSRLRKVRQPDPGTAVADAIEGGLEAALVGDQVGTRRALLDTAAALGDPFGKVAEGRGGAS